MVDVIDETGDGVWRQRLDIDACGIDGVADPALDEFAQLCFHSFGGPRVGGQGHRLRAYVVADAGFYGVRRVELEHGLDLSGGQSIDIGDARSGEIGDRLDEGVAGDAFVDGPAFRADIVGEAGEYLLDRATREAFQVECPKGLANTVGARVIEETDKAGPRAP